DARSVAEDGSLVIDPRGNDSTGPTNEATQTLTVSAVGLPSHGTAAIIASGADPGKILYTPAANYNGPDSFSYTITDNGPTNGSNDFKSASAQVTMTVTPVNDAPVATSGSAASTNEGTLVSASITFTDLEPSDTHTCSISWGDGIPAATGSVTEPSGSTAGTCSGSHTYADDNPTG